MDSEQIENEEPLTDEQLEAATEPETVAVPKATKTESVAVPKATQFPAPGTVKKPAPLTATKSDSDRLTALEKEMVDLKARLAKKIAYL